MRGMVDVSQKGKTHRIARAKGSVRLKEEVLRLIKEGRIPKGDVLESARVAGILAAKRTSELIPHCHNIAIEFVGVEFKIQKGKIEIETEVRAHAKTGVEMEALSACAVSGLTIYDMCKMFDRTIVLEKIYLKEKRGGKSGTLTLPSPTLGRGIR